MSRSTTSTSVHTILKYSRAYPKPSDVQSQSCNPSGEWQHFMNPVLRVLLDVKKSLTSEELESVKLRVSWNIDSGGDAMDVNQREFVFEDLDLLSYSSCPATSLQSQISQSLPIKAVFRDSVVGIRYLHPRVTPPGSTPCYRRFQMTFASASAASQFVESICPVCPCKANQPTPAQPSHQTRKITMNVVPNFQPQNFPTARCPPPLSASFSNPSGPTIAMPSRQLAYDHKAAQSNSSLQFSDPIDPASYVQITASSESGRSSSNVTHHSSSHEVPTPSSSAVMLPPPSEGETNEIAGPDFLASLRKSPTLYDLSQAQLEDLVAQVVREDGFVKLLESLDSMWKIKGFLGR